MARKPRVLHVEDREAWLKTIKSILEPEYEVFSYETLDAAKKAAAEEEFDYYICDTNISGEDGSLWAKELHDQGKKAMTLATEARPGVPFLNKGELRKAALKAFIESL